MVSVMTTAAVPGRRVLIVEDEAVTALDLSRELARLGYDVCGVVDTSAEAVRLAMETRPELVLMDVRLADGSDGIDTAREIARGHDTVIVFLSANSDEATLARALDVSPFGFLIKPFRARDLKVAIELALAKHAHDEAAVRALHALASTDPLTGLANRHISTPPCSTPGRCAGNGVDRWRSCSLTSTTSRTTTTPQGTWPVTPAWPPSRG